MPHPWPECLKSLAACLRVGGAPQRRGLFGFVSFPVPLLPEVRFLDTNFELQWNPSKGMEYTESFEQFGWWNNSADVHAAELQNDLEQMAKIADPENPDKL